MAATAETVADAPHLYFSAREAGVNPDVSTAKLENGPAVLDEPRTTKYQEHGSPMEG
jgi:hypothetical protein